MSNQAVDISVVVPVYKERANIVPFLRRIKNTLNQIGSHEIIFCLDPCSDGTEEAIREEMKNDSNIGLIVFSRRFGQPAATIAGILNCIGNSCVVIDVDLQDPPETILDLYKKYQEGYDVVCAKRRSREGETLAKLLISYFGYKIINKISDVKIPRDTGDFRIISRRVMEELRLLKERHGFLRGLNAYIGFNQASVEYDRSSRHSGKGNYNRIFGSLKIGFNGIIGFSTVPLSMLLWIGFTISSISFFGIIYILFSKFFLHIDYPLGIPTITIFTLFMGGINIMALGIIGEYIGRIYEEVRQRPQYIIDRSFNVKLQNTHGPSFSNH